MGNEFCKGCQDNCLSNALEQDFSNNNRPEEHIIYKNSEYFENKTSPSILFSQNPIGDNNKSENYILNTQKMTTNGIDKKKLNNIILNYHANILIKYFRKFKILKQKILNQIVIENYFISPFTSRLKTQNKENSSIFNNINNNITTTSINNLNKTYTMNINTELDIDISPKNSYIYIGHKFNDKKESYGLEKYSDINARYFGFFKNGKKCGFCRFSTYNKEVSFIYFGQVLNDKINGYGYYENSKKGLKYEGYWKNSMRNGYGIEQYKEGGVYKGTFLKGKKHGIGVYLWMDKSSYEGQWENNYINGYGKYNFSDGSIYTGSWRYNKMEGYGEHQFSTEKTYIGFYKNNVKSGFGVLYHYIEKKAFVGFWDNNKQNGLGQFINNDKIIFGIWNDGKLINKIKTKNEFFNKMSNYEKKYIKNFQSNNYSEFQKNIKSRFIIN